MKFNFRKISAVATSVLLAGMTVGVAAAANYPAPFVSGSSADVAIVYGTGQGVSIQDSVQAGNIQLNLQTKLGSGGSSSSGSSVSGGDSVKFEKTSTKFQLGLGIKDIITTSVTDDSPGSGLSTLLADGKFVDDDNDEFDYTQEIAVANHSLTMFEDSDYKEDQPGIGLSISSGANVLNYTLDFTDEPDWSDLATSDLKIMGKDYYILSVTTNTTLNLLDSAQKTTLAEGESTTLNVGGKTYDVSLSFIGSNSVKFNINGKTTNSLSATQTQRLPDGAYIGVRSIDVQDYSGGTKLVEFSIGKGKLTLKSGNDVELNDETISNLGVTITNTGGSSDKISSIKLQWDADDDLFIAEGSEPLMPGFEAVKFSFAGMVFPTEETVMVESKGGQGGYIQLSNFPLKDSTEDITIVYANATAYIGVGKDSDNMLRTPGGVSGGVENGTLSNITFNANTDDYFVVSWNDGNDAESYLMRATGFTTSDSGVTNKTTFEYKKNGVWGTKAKTDAKIADTVSIGNAEFTVGKVNKDAKTVVIAPGSNVNFYTLYSKEGLQIYLPWVNVTAHSLVAGALTTANCVLNISNVRDGEGQLATVLTLQNATASVTCSNYPTTYPLVLFEEDENENIASGKNINTTLGFANSETEPSSVTGGGGTSTEIGDSNEFRNFVYSALATEILFKQPDSGQNSLKLIYHGGESYGEVYLTEAGATVGGGSGGSGQLGNIVVKDNEISSVSSKNLIVVGGSCINSAAANLLGGANCGPSFTSRTGVGAGQFLIQSLNSPYSSGKVALLVAGYEAADTVNAATYLTTQTVDTMAGKKYKGTSSTSAELVVA